MCCTSKCSVPSNYNIVKSLGFPLLCFSCIIPQCPWAAVSLRIHTFQSRKVNWMSLLGPWIDLKQTKGRALRYCDTVYWGAAKIVLIIRWFMVRWYTLTAPWKMEHLELEVSFACRLLGVLKKKRDSSHILESIPCAFVCQYKTLLVCWCKSPMTVPIPPPI